MKKFTNFLKNLADAIATPFIKLGSKIKQSVLNIVSNIKSVFKYLTDKEERNKVNELRRRRRINKVKQPKSDRAFDIINCVVMIFLIAVVVIPLLYLVANAFSDGAAKEKVIFLPKIVAEDGTIKTGMTLRYFEFIIFEYDGGIFINSFKNTAIITIVVTLGSNVLMALAGYSLSKSDFPFKKGLLIFFIITMLFSAGIVPIYLLMSSLKLTESIWGIIIISLSNIFNLLLFKTTFEGIPKELEESALLDGATSLQMFFKVILPITLPTFASCCFFTLVGCINGYSSALMFIRSNVDAKPMALIMYELLAIANKTQGTNEVSTFMIENQFSIQSAGIILSVIPILVVYPFIIRYIKNGVTLGSVKG